MRFTAHMKSVCLMALGSAFYLTSTSVASADEVMDRSEFKRPTEIPAPADNPITDAKVELGKVMFFDPRLSGNNSMSCATCHNPSFGWEDGMDLGVGMAANSLGRHTPTVEDLAWNELFFWDGRADSLEAQALGPIDNKDEMMQPMSELLVEINQIQGYKPLLAAAFDGATEITKDHIAKAIATYERTLVSGRGAFDDWVDGDENAISDSAKNGYALFTGKANCVSCHDGWLFTDGSFHDIGLNATDDKGRGGLIEDEDFNYAFKTPGLRNISYRAPYMHDGSFATLKEVVQHYNDRYQKRPTLSEEIVELKLSEAEENDLVAFLETLNAHPENNAVSMPILPH